jgi:hypothetical protein
VRAGRHTQCRDPERGISRDRTSRRGGTACARCGACALARASGRSKLCGRPEPAKPGLRWVRRRVQTGRSQ